MEKENLKESLSHGTPEFPLAVYNMSFHKHQQVLAPLHYHSEFELLLATKGCLSVQIEETNYIVPEGHSIFVNSSLLHTINAYDNAEHSFIAIVFDFTILCSQYESSFHKYISPLIHNRLEVPTLLSAVASEHIRSISKHYETATFANELYIKHCLLEIFHLLIQNAKHKEISAHNEKSILIKEVLDYMQRHYAESVSLQQLADDVHISKEYLCRLFRTVSNSSPIKYLNRYRIRQSTYLLLQTNKSISEIAQACGFNHSSYFGKLFYEYMGSTPREYRTKK